MNKKLQQAIDCGSYRIKRPRKAITLKTKLDVVKRFEQGERAIDIANSLGLPPTTVRSIRKNSEAIQASAAAASTKSAEVTTKTRSHLMERMEKLLAAWIFDMNDKDIPLTTRIIQDKAKNLFNELKENSSESDSAVIFNASSGWFERFKKRSVLEDYSEQNRLNEDNVASSSRTNEKQHENEIPLHELADAFNYLERAVKIFEKYDNDTERTDAIRRSIFNSVTYYRNLYDDQKCMLPQRRIGSFNATMSCSEEDSCSMPSSSTLNNVE